MRLNVLSDLHLSRGSLPSPTVAADLVVLAGDIARPAQAVAWARALGQPTLYVPGNHEFYGSSIPETLRELKWRSAGSPVRVLDNEEWCIGDVRFLGSTLWTDFLLMGAEDGRDEAVRKRSSACTTSSACTWTSSGRPCSRPQIRRISSGATSPGWRAG